MIFAGDVAIAPGDAFRYIGFPDSVKTVPLCINLEGAVGDDAVELSWGVYNAHDWSKSFHDFSLGPVFIGNNHIHDLRNGVRLTIDYLSQSGFRSFGAGLNLDDARRDVRVRSSGFDYKLFGFGWSVIGCRAANRLEPGVNGLKFNSAIRLIENAIEHSVNTRVVVVIHGNYEFERYPQPAHRKLAMMLIDRGVYAVIFHHPHIVGPVERYRGRTIAYSLGNWAFSYGRFFGGKLRFPESSFHQIALELGVDGDIVHHANFQPPCTVAYERTEHVEAADFSLKPIFEGYDDEKYLRWFEANRIKRKGLPIYRDAADSQANWLRDRWVGLRQFLIDTATKAGLKSIRRST